MEFRPPIRKQDDPIMDSPMTVEFTQVFFMDQGTTEQDLTKIAWDQVNAGYKHPKVMGDVDYGWKIIDEEGAVWFDTGPGVSYRS